MTTYVTIEAFMEAARESVDRIARFYNPKPGTRIGKIDVIQRGDTAAIVHNWTNKNGTPTLYATLAFPVLPPGALLTREEADSWMGYVFHELGHAFDTNTVAWNATARKGAAFQHVLNGLEDARMERDCASKIAPGAMRALTHLNDKLVAEAMRRGVSFDALSQLPYALAVLGRGYLMGMSTDKCAVLFETIRPERREWFKSILVRLKACRDTADCAALAEAVVKEAQDNGATIPPPNAGIPQQPEEAQGDGTPDMSDNLAADNRNSGSGMRTPDEGDDEGDEGDEGDGDGEGDGDEGDEANGGAASKSDTSDKSDAEGTGAKGKRTSEGTDDNPFPKDENSHAGTGFSPNATSSDNINAAKSPEPSLSDMAQDIEKRHGARKGARGVAYPVGTPTWDKKWGKGASPNPGRFARMKTTATHGTARMRGLLQQLLYAPETVGVSRFEQHGKLKSRDIARAGAGDKSVFSKRWVDEGVETAVSIVLDGSSSMGSLMEAAATAALALSIAVESAGMPCEVSIFKTLLSYKPGVDTSENAPVGLEGAISRSEYTQGGLCRMLIVKDFAQRVGAAGNAFAAAAGAYGGGTPDYAAAMAAIDRIAKRPERRKVVFMLTDGAGLHEGIIHASFEYGPKRGVSLIGVGIGHDVSKMYPVSMNLPSSAQMLAKSGTRAMRELIKLARKDRTMQAA